MRFSPEQHSKPLKMGCHTMTGRLVHSVGHMLGAQLLRSDSSRGAGLSSGRILLRNPNNGWSLFVSHRHCKSTLKDLLGRPPSMAFAGPGNQAERYSTCLRF